MASAYTTFREHGAQYDPVVIERVEDSSGNILWEADSTPEQVITPEVADTVTYALEKVVEGGTGTAAGNTALDSAGKTGTTDNNKDAWFVGYTCDITAAVWMGNVGKPGEPVQPMTSVQGVQVQGGNFPAQMWAEFINRIDPLVNSDCAFEDIDQSFPGERVFPGYKDAIPEVAPPTTIDPSATTLPPETSAPPSTTVPLSTTVPGGGGGVGGGIGGVPGPLAEDEDDP